MPVLIAYQASSVEAFVRDVVALPPDNARSPIDHVHEEVVHRLWRDFSALIAQPESATSSDPTLAEFARSLPPDAFIADLRNPGVGSGFAWRRFGPQTVIRRCGTERLWAVIPPPRSRGFFARLWGGW